MQIAYLLADDAARKGVHQTVSIAIGMQRGNNFDSPIGSAYPG